MMFIFKEKPVELKAYVRKRHALFAEATPIIKAKEAFPTWWKNVPSSKFNWEKFSTDTTVKSCPGIINSLTTGFILPLWTDIAIEWGKDHWKTQCADDHTIIGEHGMEQSGSFYNNYWHLKITSPWLIRTPVPLFYNPPFYSYDSPLPFIMPAGIHKTIGQYAATHFFIFLEKKDGPNRYIFKAGSPVYNIIPLTERKTNLNVEIVSEEDFNSFKEIAAANNMFVSRGIKNYFRIKK
jgi:hypothetical protein